MNKTVKETVTKPKGIMACIKEFIEGYEGLKEFDSMFPKVDVDTLEENTTAYMLESVPAEPIVRKYKDGSSIRQEVFALSSREIYGPVDNIETSTFYELFAEWLETCTQNGELPILAQGKDAMSIKATTSGYLFDAEGTKAQYRIQCVLRYYQKPTKLKGE